MTIAASREEGVCSHDEDANVRVQRSNHSAFLLCAGIGDRALRGHPTQPPPTQPPKPKRERDASSRPPRASGSRACAYVRSIVFHRSRQDQNKSHCDFHVSLRCTYLIRTPRSEARS